MGGGGFGARVLEREKGNGPAGLRCGRREMKENERSERNKKWWCPFFFFSPQRHIACDVRYMAQCMM